MKAKYFILISFCLLTAAGAGAQNNNVVNTSTKANSDVHLEGINIVKTVTMNGGTLRIEGADNKITVSGFADCVLIEGANVTVNIDMVNKVKIDGANSRVFYKRTRNKSGTVPAEVFGLSSGVSSIK